MPIFIPDIFSGYLNGMRQANTDNWNDATNYNKVLQGQMNNAYAMATFDPAVNMAWNNASVSNYNKALQAANADRQLQSYALNQALGIDPMSAQNTAQALGITNMTNAQQAAINAQNFADTMQFGAEDRARQREAQRLQIEAAKQNLASTAPSSTNPFAIGTNLPGAQANQQATQPATQQAVQPAVTPEARVNGAQATLDDTSLLNIPSL